jgi:hypothetical protein
MDIGAKHGKPAIGGADFFHTQTLKKAWSLAETPYPK